MLTTLSNTKKFLFLLGLIGLGGYLFFTTLPNELAPIESRDEINVWMSTDKDSSFIYTDQYVKKLEEIYAKIPEISSYLVQVNADSSYHSLTLLPRNQRSLSAESLATLLNDKFKKIPGVMAFASVPPPPLGGYSSGGMGDSISMSVMTAGEYKDLHASMESLVDAANKYPGFRRAGSALDWNNNQFEVNIDREKAADLKVPMQTIASTISTLIAGRNVGKFEYGGKQYDIMVQMQEAALANPNIISQLYVRNDDNNMISLADIISLHDITNPGNLPHRERMRSDTLYASLAPGYTIADGVKFLQNLTQQTLPNNMKIAFSGDAKNYLEANHKMLITFLLALVFIYLVLVAQFESFIDPFIILLTVPFAVVGALFTLKLAGGTLNIYSEIGLVTLIGLIAKHGILITEFANQGRIAGKSIKAAVIDAALLRLRPILMTTMAMVLGAMPLAIAMGPGAETRHQIGWVIVGGLLIGTFFSLVVIPVAYSLLAKFKKVTTTVEVESIFGMEKAI